MCCGDYPYTLLHLVVDLADLIGQSIEQKAGHAKRGDVMPNRLISCFLQVQLTDFPVSIFGHDLKFDCVFNQWPCKVLRLIRIACNPKGGGS
ncbi:hypothetical protein LAB1_47770 [Roseibium sp. LAB1]